MKFGMERISLAEELLKTLADKGTDKGDGYQKTRTAYSVMLRQFGDGTYLVASHIGGVRVHRDHKGDDNNREPFVPIKAEKQREALHFLQEHILTDKAFEFSPQLLRRLGPDRWAHWGNYGRTGNIEVPVHEQILAVQRVVLDHTLDPYVLRRIQNSALSADKEEKPLTVAEVFRSLTDGIWVGPETDSKDPKKVVTTSVIRRNLQREYVKDLSQLVLGKAGAVPADARSLARMHLRDIAKRIDKILGDKVNLDDTTRAHLEECQERIAKVLSASLQASE
jgi:hypothetical protein